MRIFILITSMLFAFATSAATPEIMPKECEEKVLKEIGDGSAQSSAANIISSLKEDWKKSPEKKDVRFDDCGPSDYFFISILKDGCVIQDIGWGESDGECI